jgi:hypothetical protein
MMSVGIRSGASSDELTIDPASKAARATLYSSNGQELICAEDQQIVASRGIVAFGMNDETALPIRMDRLGGIATADHTMLLTDSFEGATPNAARWQINSVTMVATQSSVAGLTINSGNIVTANTSYSLQSTVRFLKTQRSPLQVKIRARINAQNNCVMDFGFGDSISATAHTTGAYWQVTSSGVVQPVVTYNGIDVTGTDVRSLINIASFYTWDVFLDDDEAVFVLQDTATGLILNKQSIKLPLTGQRLWSSTQLPITIRQFNTATPPAVAANLIVTDVYVAALDTRQNKSWNQVKAANFRAVPYNPLTGVQIQQFANSAAPASATLSNTTAGYATLGGLFQFAAVAGAATDYALFAIAIPAPTNFVCTGIDIETWNTGAAVATTPTLLVWALGVGSSAVSLATANVSRVAIGAQSLPIGAVPGAKAERISKNFDTPLVCPSGRFFHVILRMPVGTATASQIIQGMVNLEGYFE